MALIDRIRSLFTKDSPAQTAAAIAEKLPELRAQLADVEAELGVAEDAQATTNAESLLDGRPLQKPPKALDEMRAQVHALRRAIGALEVEHDRAVAAAKREQAVDAIEQAKRLAQEHWRLRALEYLLHQAAERIGRSGRERISAAAAPIQARLAATLPRAEDAQRLMGWANGHQGPLWPAEVEQVSAISLDLSTVLDVDVGHAPYPTAPESALASDDEIASANIARASELAATRRSFRSQRIEPLLREAIVLVEPLTERVGEQPDPGLVKSVRRRLDEIRAEVTELTHSEGSLATQGDLRLVQRARRIVDAYASRTLGEPRAFQFGKIEG